MFRTVLLSIVFNFIFLTLAFAAPEIKVTLSPEKISVNEPVTLRIEAQWPQEEGPYLFALPQIKIPKLKLENQAESQESFFKDNRPWMRKVFVFEFIGAEKGKTGLEKMIVPFIQPEKQESGAFNAPAIELQINAPPLPWLKILGGAAAGGLAAGLVFFFRSRRKKAAAQAAKQKTEIPVHTAEAEQKVTRVLNQKGAAPVKELVYELSKVFRDFIVSQFQIQKKTGTEDELLAALKALDLQADELKKISDIAARLREAKYIGDRISESDIKYLGEDILHFIHSKQVVGNAG